MYTIGTPFKSEDEREQRKVNRINKKPWEQEVRDEKGRKRFHGAFTGGFSAGYFNTVGSKEGWTPSTFNSSKDRNKLNQNIMDFMDEEDITNQVGNNTITSKDEFKDKDSHIFSNTPNASNAPNTPNAPNAQNLSVSSVKTSFSSETYKELIPSFNYTYASNLTASKLMRSAGFDENIQRNKNQKIGNKYYGAVLEFKDNYYGMGYTPQYDEAMNTAYANREMSFLSNKTRIKMDKFEDDTKMGFFNSNDISDYHFEEVDADERHGNKQGNKNVDYIPKFQKSNHKLTSTKVIEFEMPKLPRDYDPFNRKKEIEEKPTTKTNLGHLSMTPDKRASILSASSLSDRNVNNAHNPSIENKYLKSKFTTVEELNSSRISVNALKPPSSTDQIANYFNFKIDIPFKDDLAKVSKFAKFIAEKEGLIMGETFVGSNNLMTGLQIREEKNLFESLYEAEQSLKRAEENLNNEVTNKNNNNNNEKDPSDSINSTVKREKIKWHPEKLLCKRFKVKDPYENLVQVKGEKTGFSDLQSSLFKEEIRQTFINPSVNNIANIGNKLIKNETSESTIKQINNDQNSFIILNAKADVNLFDEIFGS